MIPLTMSLALTNLIHTHHQIVTENMVLTMNTITTRIDRVCMADNRLMMDILLIGTIALPHVRTTSMRFRIRSQGLASNIIATTMIITQHKVGQAMSVTLDINIRIIALEQRDPTMNALQKTALHHA
jgi:hypothetical protein